MGKKKKAPVTVDELVAAMDAATMPPAPPPEPEPPVEAESGLFEGLDLDVPASAVALPDTLPRLDSDLTPDEKLEFVRLLNEHMPVPDRAKQLAKLAYYTDQKRAGVAFRAIQEINLITGITGAKASEAPPMFVVPNDTKVQINVTSVSK